MRVLELDSQCVLGAYIGDVFLACTVIVPYHLPPKLGKAAFPVPMPLCFIFPPRIAISLPFMGPVVNADMAAFCDHGTIATGTRADQSGRWGGSFVINQGKLHNFLRVRPMRAQKARGFDHFLGGFGSNGAAVLILFGVRIVPPPGYLGLWPVPLFEHATMKPES